MVSGRGRGAVGTLAGRVALLTGATSAIGAATARALAAAEARVALADPPAASAQLDALTTQIREAGGQALPVPACRKWRGRARALVRRVIDEWHRLDILVVADGYDATADSGNGATARQRIGQPHPALRDLLHVATAALPPMERQGGGDIVVIAPVAGHVLRAGAGGLASARIALEVAALCDALRRQAGGRGVRVAVVESAGLAPQADAHNPASLTAEDVADAILICAHPAPARQHRRDPRPSDEPAGLVRPIGAGRAAAARPAAPLRRRLLLCAARAAAHAATRRCPRQLHHPVGPPCGTPPAAARRPP